MISKAARFLALAVVLAFAPAAHATEVFMSPGTLAGWRIQHYVGGQLTLYFTGSSCGPYGNLQLPASATTEERERLWSVMSAAKLSDKRIFVYYDNGVGAGAAACGTIRSFGYLE